MPVIDADSHVVESEATWEFMDPADRAFRPVLVSENGDRKKARWSVEGELRHAAGLGLSAADLEAASRRTGRNLVTPEAARTGLDVEARLRHLDALGIDIQVLYPTIFIEEVATTARAEIAICRGWNRWLASIWQQGQGRLRWTCVLPYKTRDAATEELDFAHEHGACAVFMRPIEGERLPADPYFYPIYEEASRRNLAMGVHIANGNPVLCELLRTPFAIFRGPTPIACHAIIMSEVPKIFPTLRWGFIEASAQWVPWIVNETASRLRSRGEALAPSDIFKRCNIYVTCQNDDDLPYILKYAGEDQLVIGIDYGHTDTSSNVSAISEFIQAKAVAPRVMEKILFENAQALYGLG
jgi:predicted TIM-barrel fold metal-dependent hydrolase